MYTKSVPSDAFLAQCGLFIRPALYVRESFPEGNDLLEQYLKDARNIFRTECDMLLHTERAFTESDGKSLSSMLKLLIDARKTWQEEHDRTSKKQS